MNKWLIWHLVFLNAFIGSVFPQEVSGNLEGVILNNQQLPVAGANVMVSSPSLQGLRSAATDGEGRFRVPGLPVGMYVVTISHVAYRETRLLDVVIRLGKTTGLGEIVLQPEVIEIEAVEILDTKPVIDPISTVSGGNLAEEAYRDLPVERDYRSIATLLPQVNESYLGDEANFGGATGLENKYFVDGVETTDPYRGVTGTTLPYNLIKEIEVKTGGYQAEYRSSLGGIVNAVTHSGGNEIHGQELVFLPIINFPVMNAARVFNLTENKVGLTVYF